jgi:hypothetical protein
MKFTKNHTQLTDEDLDSNEKPQGYFVNGYRYEIINGQSVKISVETPTDRFLRHMKSIKKAQLNCEHTTKTKTGIVDFSKAKQGRLF